MSLREVLYNMRFAITQEITLKASTNEAIFWNKLLHTFFSFLSHVNMIPRDSQI